ncbi:ABC1 family protein, partial [Trichophyton mentagrophytes]
MKLVPPGKFCSSLIRQRPALRTPSTVTLRYLASYSSIFTPAPSPTCLSSTRRLSQWCSGARGRSFQRGSSGYNYGENDTHSRESWKRSRHSRSSYVLLVATIGAATLTPAALLELAEKKNQEDESSTREREMLHASRAEARSLRRTGRGVEDDSDGGDTKRQRARNVLWRIYGLLDEYVFEVIATGFRFVHLVVLFIPVIASVPIIFLGRRVKDRDNHRRGALLWYALVVYTMERAGAAFIKLGQWAASRSDIFPPELCSMMSSLHSHAPAHPLHITKRTISRAFNGLPFDEIFEEFDEKPLGVGAIAQVYKAKLRPDLAGSLDRASKPTNLREKMRKNVNVLVKSTPESVPSSYIAIKVLHPKVDRTVRRDLRIMGFFATLIHWIPTMEWLSLPDEVEKFGEMMKLQLDLRIEAANLAFFRENFKSRTTARFPYPYTEYTTREVLVEEFAQGIPLAAFLENGGGVFQHDIAQEGLDAFLHMLLIDNFVHSDLHPGNIMVRFYKPSQLDLSLSVQSHHGALVSESGNTATESVLSRLRKHRKDPKAWNETLKQIDAEGYRPQLIFIDTGLVTELNAVNRRDFLDLFRAIAEFDGYKAGYLMIERSRQPDTVIDAEIFALRMQHLVLSIKGRTFALGNVKLGDVLSDVLYMVRNHHVRLEGDFINVVISALLLEGIGRRLDPDLDIFK